MIFKKLVLVTIFVLLHSAAWAIPPIPEIPAFPSIQSNGKTYHVDKDTGNNTTGNGSSSSPWATIQYGVNHLSTGDTLIVHEAATAYAEDIDIDTSSGTSTNWITIQGAAGDNVVISGSGGSYCVEIQNSVSYIYLKNLNIDHTQNTGIYLKLGVSHIVLEDIDVDGNDTGLIGIRNGRIERTGVNYIHYKNVEVHDHTNRGFYLFARSENLVFESCISRDNGDDGFGGHLAAPGNTWEMIGPPDNPANIMKDIYFVDCKSYNNSGDGFDLGVVKQEHVFKNCISRDNGGRQGNAFKVWGDEVWFINCLAYDNDYRGINIKPIWKMNIYILNCTFANNNPGSWGGQIAVNQGNGAYVLKDAHIYLYNNIIMSNNLSPCIQFDHTNANLQEEDNNYYYRPSDSYAVVFKKNKRTYRTYSISDMKDGTWYAAERLGPHDIGKTLADGLSDPGFVNLAGDEYGLINSSLAVDRGTDIGINNDIIGKQRPQGNKVDIGAFEYQVVKVVIRSPKNFRVVE